MKKIVFSLVAILTLTVFNFYSETSAATEHSYKDQSVTAYTGSTSGHGATYGFYNKQFSTVAVHKNSSDNPYIPFGTVCNLSTSLTLPYIDGARIRSSFTVTDTGPGSSQTPYWLDIYYGATNSTNTFFANEFGTNGGKKINYTAIF